MSSARVALDSSTLLTWILQERGWQAVDRILANPAWAAVLPGMALAEVVATARARGNTKTGPEMLAVFIGVGISIEPATRDDLLRTAELLEISKANPGPASPRTGREATLSLGDASIIAVAERLGLGILTRDQYWEQLHENGAIGVKVVIF